MKWAVVNEIGNGKKRIETTIVEAESAIEAMKSEFDDKVIEYISTGKDVFAEENATVAIYEVLESDDGIQIQGNFNHLVTINDKAIFARDMQKLLDAEKEKNEKFILFDGSDFRKPSEEFQKEWGVQKLELELTEDGRIKSQLVSRHSSARCLSWGLYEKDEEDE